MTFVERAEDSTLAEPVSVAPTTTHAPALWRLIAPRTLIVAAFAAVAAIAAAFADTAPTGIKWWDVVLTAGVAAVFTVAMSTCPRTVVGLVAVVAAMFVGSSIWLAVALLAFVIAALEIWLNKEQRLLGAMVGALAVQALLRFEPFGYFGLPSLVAGITIIGALVVSYWSIHRATRRGLTKVLARLGIVIALIVGAGVVGAATARSDAEAGITAARSGLDAARGGRTQDITNRLTEAETRLAKADDRLSSFYLQPLRLVPIAAQHHRAASVAAQQGALVAAEAVAAATEANVDQLRFRQGQFDLDLLAGMAPRLESMVARLEDVGTQINASRSEWLAPQLDNRLAELVVEIEELLPEARLSAQAARVMPGMLGSEAPRRYLMLFGSPGESREMGGFVGGYAVIELDRGDLSLVEAGRSTDMPNRGTVTPLDDPGGYPTEFRAADPGQYPQNLTSTPDISVMARAVRDIFPRFARAPIDGVIYADPYAVAAMLEFTGPLEIEGSPEPLTSTTMLDFLFEEQYRVFESRNDRFSAIDSVFAATFAELATANLPGPERLGAVLGPAARQGRLQIATYDDAENDFLRQAKLQRKFLAPTEIDSVALIQANFTASKLDLYLERTMTYSVEVDPSGELRVTVDVELRSVIPDDAPPYTLALNDDPMTNQVLLSLYSPHELISLSVDDADHRYAIQPEFGFTRYALFPVQVPAGGVARVKFELVGVAPPLEPYGLAIWHQPLVNQDVVHVAYRGPTGLRDNFSLELNENTVIRATS